MAQQSQSCTYIPYAHIPYCDVCTDIHQDITCDSIEIEATWVSITGERLRKVQCSHIIEY